MPASCCSWQPARGQRGGRIPAVSRQSGAMFDHVLAYVDEAYTHMEDIYKLKKQGALEGASHNGARKMVCSCAATGAAMLRDMLTAPGRKVRTCSRRPRTNRRASAALHSIRQPARIQPPSPDAHSGGGVASRLPRPPFLVTTPAASFFKWQKAATGPPAQTPGSRHSGRHRAQSNIGWTIAADGLSFCRYADADLK